MHGCKDRIALLFSSLVEDLLRVERAGHQLGVQGRRGLGTAIGRFQESKKLTAGICVHLRFQRRQLQC